jgi:hypothetical protein
VITAKIGTEGQVSYDPIPASGAGAGEFDQPALFYLTNQQLIDEWYALRTNVATSLDRWYSTIVRDALAAAATTRKLQIAKALGPGRHTSLVAHPVGASFLHGKPVIGAGLTWIKAVNPTANTVFASVRCSPNAAGRTAAELFLEAGGTGAVASLDGAQSSGKTWPIWRWIQAEPRWWADLDSYRDEIVESVTELLDAVLHPLLASSYVPVNSDDLEDVDGSDSDESA